jgi:hypothetical protein
MTQIAALVLAGNSAILTTNVTPSTNNSVPVVYAGSTNLALGTTQPPQIRLLNKGSSDIWLGFSSPSAVAAVIPTAGTTTLGTPQPVIWLAPGIEITLTLAVSILPLVGVAGLPLGFWLNTISVGVSQNFYLQLGEGL